MQKNLLIIAFIVLVTTLLSLLLYLDYEKYQEKKLDERLLSIVENASLRLQIQLKSEKDANSNISFDELFKKTETNIQKIDELLLEVRAIPSYGKESKINAVVDYLEKNKKLLSLSVAMDRAKNFSASVDRLNPSILDVSVGNKILDAFDEAKMEYNEANNQLLSATTNLMRANTAVSGALPFDKVLTDEVIVLSKIL